MVDWRRVERVAREAKSRRVMIDVRLFEGAIEIRARDGDRLLSTRVTYSDLAESQGDPFASAVGRVLNDVVV